MSPRSLLFSSDQETSRQLGQALYELGFQVEHCPEIFRAVEKLTSHTFEIIAADWDDGVEASFLLKTARDLKSNCEAFAIAIARPELAPAAQRAGANLVLSKPVLPGQVRHTLLTSDQFVARVRPPQSAVDSVHRPVAPVSAAPQQEPKRHTATYIKTRSAPSSSASSVEDVLPLGAHLDSAIDPGTADSFRSSQIQTLFSSEPWATKMKDSPRKGVLRRFLRRGMLGIAVVATGSVLYGPLRSGAITASVGQIYRNARETTQNWLKPSPQAASEVAAAEVPRQELLSLLPKRVITIHVGRVRPTPMTPQEISLALSQEPLRSLSQVESDPPVMQPSPASYESRIPGSLKVAPAVPDFSPKISPSLLAALEPVGLSADLSEKLLIQKVQPVYPDQAVRAGLQGLVVLQAAIGKDGLVHDLKLISGSWLLGQAACQAVRQWRYKPYFMNGHAVNAQTVVTVDFKLPAVASVSEP
jgi:periplasmic protein TonB